MKNLKSIWALACLLTATSALHAQNLEVLTVIPASADGFAVIAKLDDLNKKVGKLAGHINVPAVNFLDLASQLTGFGQEIDRNGSAAAMVFIPPDGTPADAVVVLAIPVLNFGNVLKSIMAKDTGDGVHSFQSAVGKEFVIAKRGKFALLTTSQDRPVLLKTLKTEQSVLVKTRAIETWLVAQDAAVVVLEKSLKENAKKLVPLIPAEIPGVPNEQEASVKAQLEGARRFATTVSEEGTYFAVGARVDASDNLNFATHFGFVKSGTFGKWAAAGQSKDHPLTGLPNSPYAFAFGSTFTAETMESLMGFSLESSKTLYKLSDAEAKELGAAWGSTMKGVEAMSVAVGLPQSDESIFTAAVGVMRVKDSKEYLKTYVDGVQKGNKIIKLDSATKAVKVGAFDGVETAMDMKSLLKENGDPNAEMILAKLFGTADKVTTTVVAVDSKTLLLGYVPASKMTTIAEGYAKRSQLMTAPLPAKTLKLLPANPFMVVLWNPKETMAFATMMAKNFGAELPIPPVGETPPVGIAARSDATSFELNIAVPAEVFVEIGKLVKNLKGG